MNSNSANLIRECFTASSEGRMPFGQVVGELLTAGVESYAVDYRSRRTIYYVGSEALAFDMEVPDMEIGGQFDAAAVQVAIRGSQRGEVLYPQFKRLSMQAGCVGYTVWLAGRHVSYFGRRGETHVEPFPK